jgi:hypothetical protein
MTDASRAPHLEPARFPTNCRGCTAPIRAGEPALRSPRTGALSCPTCAHVAARPPSIDARRREGDMNSTGAAQRPRPGGSGR